MLDVVERKDFDYNEIEPEMNIHIKQTIESAERKNRDRVEVIRDDMLKRLKAFNKRCGTMGTKHDPKEELQKRLKRKGLKYLIKQYRSEIENDYKDDDIFVLKEVIAILYEQTYIHQRERMMRRDEKKEGPYVFAWEVGHDHLCRIIADGQSPGGMGVTVARGNDRMIFRG